MFCGPEEAQQPEGEAPAGGVTSALAKGSGPGGEELCGLRLAASTISL